MHTNDNATRGSISLHLVCVRWQLACHVTFDVQYVCHNHCAYTRCIRRMSFTVSWSLCTDTTNVTDQSSGPRNFEPNRGLRCFSAKMSRTAKSVFFSGNCLIYENALQNKSINKRLFQKHIHTYKHTRTQTHLFSNN